jgi:hypothetical protein
MGCDDGRMSTRRLPVVETRLLRPLTLTPGPGRPAHVSAASAAVLHQGRLCVVADDELALARFALAPQRTPDDWLPLLPGSLPVAHAARKAAKPDFEVLLALPDDRLLALGSGSLPQRQRGVLLQGDRPREVDLAPLYAPLHAAFGALNLEGGFFAGDRIMLLQRASRGAPGNACIQFEAAALLRWLDGHGPVPLPLGSQPLELGDLQGVRLGLTDGCALSGGGFLFSAAAEDSADTVADGGVAGSVIGEVGADGRVVALGLLDRPCKVEGLAVRTGADGGPSLLLVTDADDRALPALLLEAAWPASG